MNRDEFNNNPEAQKKFYIFLGAVALVILWLWFGGSARTAVRAMSVRKPAPPPVVAAPLRAAPPPVAAAPAPAKVNPATVLQSPGDFMGHWRGATTNKGGFCNLTLELRQEQEGRFLGYPSFACTQMPTPGSKMTANPMLALAGMNPASAIMSGEWKDGSIDFHVTKITSTNDLGCTLSDMTVTAFGSGGIAAQWKDACGGGNMLLRKER